MNSLQAAWAWTSLEGSYLPWSENIGIAAASCGVWGGKSLGWDNTGSCRRGKVGQVGNPRV